MASLFTIFLIGLTLSSIARAQNTPDDFLKAHKKFRDEVGASEMFWDDEVAAYAKRYAESKIDTCEMVHSDTHYGENLATVNGDLTAEMAVQAWADEKKYYDYNANKCVGGECRHYTQLVWKDSFLLGCATVKCKNNWTLISCNYSPTGNVVGEKPY